VSLCFSTAFSIAEKQAGRAVRYYLFVFQEHSSQKTKRIAAAIAHALRLVEKFPFHRKCAPM